MLANIKRYLRNIATDILFMALLLGIVLGLALTGVFK